MNDVTAARRPGRAIPVLLGLMFLAQLGIANEIRYQGCVARYYEATFSQDGDLQDPARSFDCGRIPLL